MRCHSANRPVGALSASKGIDCSLQAKIKKTEIAVSFVQSCFELCLQLLGVIIKMRYKTDIEKMHKFSILGFGERNKTVGYVQYPVSRQCPGWGCNFATLTVIEYNLI